jgi:hypothetical protein
VVLLVGLLLSRFGAQEFLSSISYGAQTCPKYWPCSQHGMYR